MDYSFGNWVRRRRKALDLTQQELAERIGCSISLIFKIESDERRPSRQVARLLAMHLEIPSEEQDLFLKVARQEKSLNVLEPAFPSSASISVPTHLQFTENAPIPLTSIIGREQELRAIIRQLQDPACRLLTLTGPGGVGKTRLALEAAHQLREFEHGTYFVSLVGTSASEFIVPAIAQALRFSFSGANELKTQLFNFLRGKRILLALDNLEHLLEGIEVLDELLEQAPHIKLLATSREQLNLRSEWIFEIQGLPVSPQIELNNLGSNSAATLFIQRVKQANVNFTLSQDDLPAIRRICELVEGLPLGLELAAAWVRIMSLQEIAGEIEKSLDFLTTTARDVPKRHRSIRAVFDYSWSLLTEDEQRCLRQLAVFRGGFTREAAEQVSGATLHHLSALVQKSLLRPVENHSERFDFHELVRQHAVMKLQEASEEYDQAQDRLAGFCAAWLRQREGQLAGPQLQEALFQIGLEMDNIRSAWDWMVSHHQIHNLRQSLVSLFILHDIRNWIRQGATLFGKAVIALQPHEGEEGYTIALGELMVCEGHMTWHLGDIQKARSLFSKSLKWLSPYRDCEMLAELLLNFSILEHSQGDYESALRLAEECVSLNRQQGRSPGTGYALSNLGLVHISLGEYKAGYAYLQESVHMMRSIEHSRGTAVTLTRLGAAALQLDKLDEAEELLEEGLEIAQRINDRWGIGNALNYLGLLQYARGDLERAELLIRDSLALFEEDGDPLLQASTLTDLGYILHDLNAGSDSRQVFLRALQTAARIRAAPIILNVLVGIATLLANDGAVTQALELVMHTRGHPSSNQHTKDRAVRLRDELESKLSPVEIEAVGFRAQSLTLDAIIQQLLQS